VILIDDPVSDLVADPGFGYAVAHAVSAGIPVVVAASDHTDPAVMSSYAAVNGVIAVGGSTLDGRPVSWSPAGVGLTVVAPGTINGRDAEFRVSQVSSTGIAAAMVAGLLARGRQVWPEATGNQLIASLIHTASGAGVWTPQLGWGMIEPGPFLANDPSQYPDENPLLDKMGSSPGSSVLTRQMLSDYQAGLADPRQWIVPYRDYEYVYRGSDLAVLTDPRVRLPKASPAPVPVPDGGGIPAGVAEGLSGAAVVVVLVAVWAVWRWRARVAARRKEPAPPAEADR